MTLAITIASLSLSGATFNQKELHELSLDDRASLLRQCHSIVCDAATGKVHGVMELKPSERTLGGESLLKLMFQNH